MRKRSYTGTIVLSEIYCSSSYDHYIDVLYYHNGKRYVRDFDIDGGVLIAEHGGSLLRLPAYFEAAIQAAVLERLKSGNYRVYEYDRDHNKRHTGLRYHEPEWAAHTIARLEREVGNRE